MEQNPERLPEDQAAIAAGLNEIARVLDSFSISFILEGGTLLGIIRENRFLPWDDDVGIAVRTEDIYGRRDAVKEALSRAGFEIGKCDDTWENCKINALKYGARYEILGWFLRGKWRRRYNHRMSARFLAELKPIEFMGYRFFIPERPERYLKHFYGNWKVVRKSGRFFSFLSYDQKKYWGKRIRRLFGIR